MLTWLRQRKYSEWLAIITPVVTFIVGFIGGKLLETIMNPLFDNSSKAILTGTLIAGLLSTILLIVISTFAHRAEAREKIWLKSIGAPTELLFERTRANKGTYYYRLKSLIEQVSDGDEILMMSKQKMYNSSIDIRETEARKKGRDAYSKALLKKVKEKDVGYHRVICFEDCMMDVGLDPRCVKPWLINHCRDMLELKKSKPHDISLKVSKAKISADIFVIPNKVGILVVDIYDSLTGEASTYASLIFHNPPNAHIIDQLEKWFYEIEGEAVPITSVP